MMTSFFLPVFKTRVAPLQPTTMANEVLLFSVLVNSDSNTPDGYSSAPTLLALASTSGC